MWHAAHLPVPLVLPVCHGLIDTVGKDPAVTAERQCVLIGALAAVILHLRECWILSFRSCLLGDDERWQKENCKSRVTSFLFFRCGCCTPRRRLLGFLGPFGGQTSKHLDHFGPLILSRLRTSCQACVSRGFSIYFQSALLISSGASTRPPAHFAYFAELRAGCLSSPLTEHQRCFKNHKWALNYFNLPARMRTERGKNNQHQFCQLSSLCLLGWSQLAQIQLLRKVNERPHNCLDDTLSRCILEI